MAYTITNKLAAVDLTVRGHSQYVISTLLPGLNIFIAAGETCTGWYTWTESWNAHWIFAGLAQWAIYILLGVRASDVLWPYPPYP